MAIIDAENRLSSAQAITATAASTNVIDLTNAREIGNAGAWPLKISAFVTEAFSGGTSVQVQLQGSVDNSSWTTYAEGPAYAVASLTAGAKLLPLVGWPHRGPGNALPRYIRANYVVVGTPTAGKITCDLTIDRRDATQYPSGITITN